jgi:3-deoxy-manno-octulosonate cytidylyltransferase (CMP-KDO synthetase)
MVVRVAEQASRVRGLQQIIVATDSEEIISVVKKAGFEARMTPESLRSGTDRVAYIAKDLSADIIVNLQGDEPVCPPLAIEAAIKPVSEGRTPMGSVFTRFANKEEFLLPSAVKVLTDKNQNAIYFSRHAIPCPQNPVNDQELLQHPNIGKHLGIYAFQKEFLLEFTQLQPSFMEQAESLEQLRALYHGFKIGMGFSQEGSQSVDTAEDLEKARAVFRKNFKR